MRKVIVVVAAALLAACGSSSTKSSSPKPLGGTIGGQAFTPKATQAIVAGTGSSPCEIPTFGDPGNVTTLGARAVELVVTSAGVDPAAAASLACADLASSACTGHASAQKVTILAAKGNPVAPAYSEPASITGTYTVYTAITTAVPDGAGNLNIAYAEALALDPACAGTVSRSAGGTIRLDSVSASSVSGYLSIDFDDGSRLAGDFTAPICPGVNPNVCERALSGALCAGTATCP